MYPEMSYKNLSYEVQIPDSFNREKLRLRFDKGDGKMTDADFTMEFRPLFEKGAKVCVLRAQLQSDDGLMLWEEEKTIDIAYVRIELNSPETVSVYAMEDDIQRIKARVTNNSDIDVTVLPSFVLSFDSKSRNKKQPLSPDVPIKLMPGEKRDLYVNVKVAENEDISATISISVDGFECCSASSRISLKKI